MLAKRIRELLLAKKGENIRILDMRNLTEVTDYFVIVSGGSAPHIRGLYNGVQEGLKAEDVLVWRRSDDPESGWMILDYVDVVIHILTPKARQYYGIEDLWAGAPEEE